MSHHHKMHDHNAEQIVRGEHRDPFSYLGMHRDGKHHIVVRTFQPYWPAKNKSLEVVHTETGQSWTMERIHQDGLFAVRIKESATFPYRFRFQPTGKEVNDPYRFSSSLGDLDHYLLAEGSHYRMFDKLGAHPITVDGISGTCFAVWAPNASRVSVVGDFNRWDGRCHSMRFHPSCGVWEVFIPGLEAGTLYKYELKGAENQLLPLKTDPCGFLCELPPKTASVVYDLEQYQWNDAEWMKTRQQRHHRRAPMSIYEVHLGSWKRNSAEDNDYFSYSQLADELVPYVKKMGFTHIELLPVNEHPFAGSWGYQPIGIYAPTSRYGTPDEFRTFVDRCHQEGIGIILDWVGGHFPEDGHGLREFDGTHLYEHADERQGMHKEWGTRIYNYGRTEVSNFLIANALFWLEKYHIDGLRVDAVASMLYLDYNREEGQWIANHYGGNENLEAVAFIKRMNHAVYSEFPGAFTVAEESTAWPMVSQPADIGGLGFGFKWNMGWMNDTLRYISKESVHRSYHQNDITFGLLYAFHENFVLPISHDEVVHGKCSMISKMPGDDWQRFANLRLYYAFQFTHPGKKLLFMGSEFGQHKEWDYQHSLDWHLLDDSYVQKGLHEGVQKSLQDLNRLYREKSALHELDCEGDGFSWIDCTDAQSSVIAFMRFGIENRDKPVIVICNFTPATRENYRIGVPMGGNYKTLFNSDDAGYGGSGVHNGEKIVGDQIGSHGHEHSLNLTLPPLGCIVLERE